MKQGVFINAIKLINYEDIEHYKVTKSLFGHKDLMLKQANIDIDFIPVSKRFDKADWVNPKGAILVDDFSGNLYPWKAAGGISIKFVPEQTTKEYPFLVISRLDQIIGLVNDGKIKVR